MKNYKEKMTLKKCAYILNAIKNVKNDELKNNSCENIYNVTRKKVKVKGIKF